MGKLPGVIASGKRGARELEAAAGGPSPSSSGRLASSAGWSTSVLASVAESSISEQDSPDLRRTRARRDPCSPARVLGFRVYRSGFRRRTKARRDPCSPAGD